MTLDRIRWLRRAQDLRFHQLDVARRQAESWRTGLASLTGLLTAVLIIKGRDNISDVTRLWQWTVVVLLGCAITALIAATLVAIRAASGVPGDQCLLTGEDLERWTKAEVVSIHRSIRTARLLAVAGVAIVTVAVGIAWLAPPTRSKPMLRVDTGNGTYCGQPQRVSDGGISLRTLGGATQLVPLTDITMITAVTRCP